MFVRLFCLVGLFALTLGCSDGNPPVTAGVVIRGIITQGGKPLSVPHQDIGVGIVEVVLADWSNPADAERALAKSDGTFSIVGQGKGLKPGKYRLAIYQRDKGFGSDQLEGKFSDKNSPIEVQIEANKIGGEVNLGTLELEKYVKE